MHLASTVKARIATLVHPGAAAGRLERARHAAFIGLHLAPSLASLLVLPVALAFHGAPTGPQAACVLLLQAPLVSAALLARGASFQLAQIVAAFGFLALGAVLAVAFPQYEALAALVFAIALIEGASALDGRTAVATACGLAAALAGVAAWRFLHPLPAASGKAGLLALGLAPAFLYAGALAFALAHTAALRGRVASREAARRRALAGAVGDLVLLTDRGGAVLSSGVESGPFLALSFRDLAGRGLYERVHLADRPAFLQTLSDAFAGALPPPALLRLRTATVRSARGAFQEPVYAWVEMRARRSVESEAATGGPDAVLCLMRDVTAFKEREDQIGEARSLAERAEKSRERFLANVSHELRTPLNAIIGFADLLGMEKIRTDPNKCAEYAGIISASGHHLLSVVNTILDMSKLEAGSFDIEPKHVSPAPLFGQCLDIVRLKAGQSGVALLRDYSDDLAAIVADERALRQIVINLLSNAVKFTPKGGTVRLAARTDGGLVLSVEDTGIGIAAADMTRIGDAFFQASNARSRAFEGTGLGLSLVRGLVGLHGGAIDVESAPDSGTIVTVRLPADCRGTAGAAPATIHAMPRSLPLSIDVPKVKTHA